MFTYLESSSVRDKYFSFSSLILTEQLSLSNISMEFIFPADEASKSFNRRYILYLLTEGSRNFFLMVVPLRPYPPPPLELNGSRNFVVGKKSPTYVLFSLMARPLTPPPLNGTAVKKNNFFAASLMKNNTLGNEPMSLEGKIRS